MMDGELKQLLRAHRAPEGTGELGGLRDILVGLRRLAGDLRLDFGEALSASEAVCEERLLEGFDPCL
jgi:hypothetical protein